MGICVYRSVDFVELFDQITLKCNNTVLQLNAVVLCVGERLLTVRFELGLR